MDSKMEEKWIKHYSSRHKILLVGEGDFSFALSLANAFGSASNMVATSLDSKRTLKWKYSNASTNLEELTNLGCTIVHKVDAHSMHEHPSLQNKFFDRIVYNFPHAGFGRNFDERCPHQIELHKNLVSGFLNNARKMLIDVGEVHVTHKNGYPYCKWDLVKLAKEAGLMLVEKVRFEIWEYPGYNNKFGSGKNCDGNFSLGDCSTYKFSIKAKRRKKKIKARNVGSCVSGRSASTISVSGCATGELVKPMIETVGITAVEPDKPETETVGITVVDIETVEIIVVEPDKTEIETVGINVVESDEPVIETIAVTGVGDGLRSSTAQILYLSLQLYISLFIYFSLFIIFLIFFPFLFPPTLYFCCCRGSTEDPFAVKKGFQWVNRQIFRLVFHLFPFKHSLQKEG